VRGDFPIYNLHSGSFPHDIFKREALEYPIYKQATGSAVFRTDFAGDA